MTGIGSVVWVLGLEKLCPESLNRPVICSKVMLEQDKVGRHKAGLFLLTFSEYSTSAEIGSSVSFPYSDSTHPAVISQALVTGQMTP